MTAARVDLARVVRGPGVANSGPAETCCSDGIVRPAQLGEHLRSEWRSPQLQSRIHPSLLALR